MFNINDTFHLFVVLNVDQITTLNLDNQRISKLINLDKLVNLRWASFNDNDISKVEGLDSCSKLEELSLNNNNISTLSGKSHCQPDKETEKIHLHHSIIIRDSVFALCFSGLSRLRCLNKLSVDGNQLTILDASVLDQLPNLSFLSVENNCISSLHGIHRVRSLLELYIGNNQISTSQDIYYLKARGTEITMFFRFSHHFNHVVWAHMLPLPFRD